MSRSKSLAYQRLFEDVRAVLNRHDPMALIEFGAPENEYDLEVETILPRLKTASGPKDVQAIVTSEIDNWFGEGMRPPEPITAAVAIDIWAVWERFRDSSASP